MVAVALCVLYFRQSLAAPFNSDGAANVLQGQAIIGGNPLLRGWWTSDVSFYTTELPEYALVTAVRGLSPDVVHLCGALTYTLTVALTALVARGRDRNTRAGLVRMALATAMMIAPSILGGTEVFLENPDHFGTAVPVLLLLLLLDRADGLKVPVAACFLLALAQVGDGLTLVAATLPVALASATRLAGRRRTRQDGLLLAAAVLSVGLAKLTEWLVTALGGFDLRPLAGVAPIRLSQLRATASVLWQAVVELFGANGPGTPRQPQMIKAHTVLVLIADLHLAGLVLAGAALAAGTAAVCARKADRVTQVIVAAIGVVLAAGLFTTVMRSLGNAHEVAILLPLAAALTGRVLPNVPAAKSLAVVLGAWLALGLAALCYGAAWPPAQLVQQQAVAWLTAHHQHEGLAGYWEASVTTVTSGGQVTVAPIGISSAGAAAQPGVYHWESSAAWYGPGESATFVIAVIPSAARDGSLTVATVTTLFGRPKTEHTIGQDVIMLYDRNLLPRLRGR